MILDVKDKNENQNPCDYKTIVGSQDLQKQEIYSQISSALNTTMWPWRVMGNEPLPTSQNQGPGEQLEKGTSPREHARPRELSPGPEQGCFTCPAGPIMTVDQ